MKEIVFQYALLSGGLNYLSLLRLFTSKEDDFSMDLDLCDADDMML